MSLCEETIVSAGEKIEQKRRVLTGNMVFDETRRMSTSDAKKQIDAAPQLKRPPLRRGSSVQCV